MNLLKKAARFFADLFEIYLPIGAFIVLFVAFLINIVFRYVIKNPQNWTFELSVNAFVVMGLMGACVAHRMDDHVIFDLLYARLSPRGQNVMRVSSGLIVIVFLSLIIPECIIYLWKLRAVTSIMKIPDGLIFMSFPAMMISITIRSAYRMVLDIKAFRDKTYVQSYNTGEKEALI